MIARARHFLKRLGPGLITGAADDDPSGIATYSQAGAQFGFGMLWSVLLTTPLMVGIQVVSARIGRVTGHGIARNIRDHYPRPLLWFIVALLVVANTLNIAADIGAMGQALQLVVGGPAHGHALVFGLVAVAFQLFVPYQRLAPVLKWLTLALFAYVLVLLLVHVPWGAAVVSTFWPSIEQRRLRATTMPSSPPLSAITRLSKSLRLRPDGSRSCEDACRNLNREQPSSPRGDPPL